jgi:hypothetical protein
MIATLLPSAKQFSVCSVHYMPVTRFWICAAHQDLSLSILQFAEALAHSAVRVPRGNGHVANLDLALAFVSHDRL